MSRDTVVLAGGPLLMGSDSFYPEESPVHEVHVAAFALDRYAVTNAQFAEFVDATGYVTIAERPLDAGLIPDVDPQHLAPGSLVFTPTGGPVDLRDHRRWWRWVVGASWRRPEGPGSAVDGREQHPVVHIALPDAEAYAAWRGARLPTEPEWEFAARGGLRQAVYAWGDEPHPPGEPLANTWQGRFPYENRGARGWRGTSPVGSFPPNGYGLSDMVGNTWEWTSSPWTGSHADRAADRADRVDTSEPHPACGCSPEKPASPPTATMLRVLKGGSHLCAPEYCLRYRPAARSPQDPDSATSHIGFRCAR